MLPVLYNMPRSDLDWQVWSKAHQDSHTKIVQALAKQGVNVVLYQFDPINFADFEAFMNRNQQAHNDMLRNLNISGADLTSVDISDDNQLAAWTYLHAIEHRDVETSLGI